ncbi:MAG: WXG100 family type VII secretion target [Clostridia bacterium]|nr:WXG100 family type VII secretion target [Clostridia bacterium]
MADIIKVSASEMQATVTKYTNARANMDDAFSAMEQAMNHLDNCWKGPAWAAMMAKWYVINGNIRRSDTAIEMAINGLNNTINTMVNAETTNTNTAKNLEVGSDSTVYV